MILSNYHHKIGLSLLVVAAVVAACTGPAQLQPEDPTTSSPAQSGAPVAVHIGYFPNITHSQALIGLARGDFQKAMGSQATIDAKVFNAGPSVIEALFAGQIDLSYIGPNPAINGYVKSNGEALRIIAGATSGGAAFIVRPDANISEPQDLNGKKLATPQLGNTQDVALRNYLAEHGLQTMEEGGKVEIIPTDNSQILNLFKQGQIDGAWVPEPWATRLIVEGGGKLFIDERDLWSATGGEFVTAHIIVSAKFLKEHPDLVKAFLRTHVEVTQWEQRNPEQARQLVNEEIKRLTGQALAQEVIDGAWSRLRATYDPISASLIKAADSAYAAGFLKEKPDLSNIYDLHLLSEVLEEKDLAPIEQE